MSSVPNFHCWGFVIDTDQYAGSFERELCAHITGHVGECGVGEDFVEDGVAELFNNVVEVPDEHGCRRPCAIYPNPKYKNNGMGFAYQDGQENVALQKLKESYLKQAEHSYQVYADKACAKKEKDRWTKMANDVITVPAYDCYNSVVIYLESEPTIEQIDIMKQRAMTFELGEFVGKFNIEGFRVVEFTQTSKSKKV
jgi:hypothetical protein